MKIARALSAAIGAAFALSPVVASALPSTPEIIAARQKFFGAENVDSQTGNVAKDKVLVSWLTNTTYAVSMKGRVVLLDSFATRLEVQPGRTNFVIKDLVDLKPEAIFLGHGHSDHADNAAYIAAKSGAAIFASSETCPVMHFDLARMKADPIIQNDPVARIDLNAAIKCTGVTSVGSVPGSEVVKVPALDPEVCVIGFRHLHSILVPRDPEFAVNPVPVTVDPRDATLFPAGTRLTPFNPPQPGQMDLRTGIGFGANPGGPVAIAFQFVMRESPNFTVIWTNSNGALKEGRGNGWNGTPEDGARLVQLMKSLPHTDVFMGITSTGNYPNNALRDTVMYTEALRPRLFLPGHHTTGTVGAEGTSAALYTVLRKQFEIMEAPVGQWPGFSKALWPDFRWLTDPMDYGKPIVFDPKSKEWARNELARNEQAHRIRQYCSN